MGRTGGRGRVCTAGSRRIERSVTGRVPSRARASYNNPIYSVASMSEQ
jgi:hypothetical protein